MESKIRKLEDEIITLKQKSVEKIFFALCGGFTVGIIAAKLIF